MTLRLLEFGFKSLITFTLLLALTFASSAQSGKIKRIDKWLSKGDTLKARGKLNQWIEKKPDYAPFYWKRAMIKIALNDDYPALIDLNTFSSLGGKNPRLDYVRAMIQMRSGNYKGAQATLKKYVSEHPEDFKARDQIAYCYLELNQFEQALTAYSQALSIKPYNPDALYNTGLAAFKAGHNKLADSLLFQAHKANPLDQDILLARGVNLFAMRDYQESVQVLKKLTSLNPSNGKGWYNLGVSYYFLDQTVAACEAWIDATKVGNQAALLALERYCGEAEAP